MSAIDKQQLASAAVALLTRGERPCMFSRREGATLRLVAPNERLGVSQLEQQLLHILTVQPHMQQLLTEQLSACHPCKPRATRHIAAWLRGCCYLASGNSRQALRDACAAIAYAPAPAPPPAPAPAPGNAAASPLSASQQLSPSNGSQDSRQSASSCTWFPALLLAGEAYLDMQLSAQAVLHLAQAEHFAPHYAAPYVSSVLHQAVQGLAPDQAYAWATGGVNGLQQQLADEADMRLPEVLRPRPKWYYYNQWMKQRIQLTLLELHLARIMPPTPAPQGALESTATHHNNTSSSGNSVAASGGHGSSSSNNVVAKVETSISSTRGRLLLGLLARGSDESPDVAAAAAAAGFQAPPTAPALSLTVGSAAPPAAASDAASLASSSSNNALSSSKAACYSHSSISSASAFSSSSSSSKVLQLPEPVMSKLLAMDANDLDLLVQHPVALQGQVYELLDVLQGRGAAALQEYVIPALTWEEVQGLAGPGIVGLPWGYTPSAVVVPPVRAVMPATPQLLCSDNAEGSKGSGTQDGAITALAAVANQQAQTAGVAAVTDVSATAVAATRERIEGCDSIVGDLSWHRAGWTRAQYVEDALEAADKMQQ